MDFNQLFNQINHKNEFLIIPDNSKRRIVKIKSQYEIKNHILFDFKILTTSELIDLLSFKELKDIYLNQLEKYQTPISITKEKIKFSKYNLNKEHNELTEFLINNKSYYHESRLFIKDVSNYHFNILSQDVLIKPFLEYYKISYSLVEIKEEKEPLVKKFMSLSHEIFYLFETISSLLEKKEDINHIYISNIDSNYQKEILKVSNFYHIPVNIKSNLTLYDLSYIRDIMSNDLSEVIRLLTDDAYRNEVFKTIREIDENSFDQSINDLISIFNQYDTENYHDTVIMKVIKDELKQKKIYQKELKNAISVIDLEEIIGLEDNDKVFILNTKYEAFPKISKDNDYLSDDDKLSIKYPTSSEINLSNNQYLDKIIHLKQVAYLSYSEKDKYQQYTPSDLSAQYQKDKSYTLINIDDLKKGYAKNYYKSFFSKKNETHLLTHFTGEFKLLKDEKEVISTYIKEKEMSLSPTSVTTYFKIPFIYYIEKVLGLDSFTKRVDIYLGDFFHILIEVLFVLKYEEKVHRETEFSHNKELNNEIINYIIKKELTNFSYDIYFDEFFKLYFNNDLEKLEALRKKDIKEITDEEKLLIRTHFYILKNKHIITKALERLIDFEDNVKSEFLYLEKSVNLSPFKGRADLVKVYADKTFSVIDYKTGSKDSFHYEKILEIFKALLSDNKEEELAISNLSLLQLIFYAYFINKEDETIKLRNLSFYSYFEENLKLNALSTEDLDKTYFTTGKNRILSQENLEEIYKMIDKLLKQTIEDIYQANFPIRVRKDINQKENLEEGIYSIYEALAYFNTNIIQEDNEDE